jgi:hypothetical protein
MGNNTKITNKVKRHSWILLVKYEQMIPEIPALLRKRNFPEKMNTSY